MQQIAAWGKGRFYEANDPSVIPQILLDETQQAQQQATINETFTPSIVEPHPILAGLGPLPQLNGYVATTPKPAAQQVLISNLNDPVLAVWQYGLGRVVAWTSDALGLWTANWLRWSAAARWWANLVTWTLPAPNSQLLVNGEVFGYRWLTCRLGLLRTAQAREDAGNVRLGTIRTQREASSRGLSRRKPMDSVAKTLNISSPGSQPQPDREGTTTSKKQPEVLMTEKLLEAKRKRASEKKQRE